MKLVDGEETILIVVASALESGHPDRESADRLRTEIDIRGSGFSYRRAVVIGDEAWFATELFHGAPTIAVGGPGVNAVAGRFAAALPSVWTDGEEVVIQAVLDEGPRQASLWGVNREATAAAVEAFINRGWLEEFLERCWRYRGGQLA
jgi:hypothetical protein